MFEKRTFVGLFALLVIVAASPALGLVKGAPAPNTEQIQVIKGQFIAENGELTSFRLPDRGAIAVRNEATGDLVMVSGKVLGNGRVELSFERYALGDGDTPSATDRVQAKVGGKAVANGVAAFRLAVQEIGTATRTIPASAAPTPVPAETCCVTCGGWRVCCTVSGGWCCEIESSCGSSCSAGPCDAETVPN